ncbi:MAG: hypothetical protein R3D67_05095 [Hyphomicrobiaceae bacterium]
MARDIGYALSQSPFKAKGQRIEVLRLLADGVVAHLRKAGWLFALKPPDALHGPSAAGVVRPGGNTTPDSCEQVRADQSDDPAHNRGVDET